MKSATLDQASKLLKAFEGVPRKRLDEVIESAQLKALIINGPNAIDYELNAIQWQTVRQITNLHGIVITVAKKGFHVGQNLYRHEVTLLLGQPTINGKNCHTSDCEKIFDESIIRNEEKVPGFFGPATRRVLTEKLKRIGLDIGFQNNEGEKLQIKFFEDKAAVFLA